MLKNTYYLILFLSVFAALIVGLNIGKRMGKQGIVENQISIPTGPVQRMTPTTEPFRDILQMTSPSGTIKNASPSGIVSKNGVLTVSSCGITLSYPDILTAQESTTETQGTVFINKTNPKDMIVLTCQKDIPKPALPPENTENRLIGTTTATLYHDTSQKDGAWVDGLLFTHPKTKLDVFIGGYGATFNQIIQTIKIQ